MIVPHVQDRILELLRRYASEPAARGMLRRAYTEARLAPGSVSTHDMPRLFDALSNSIRLFVDERSRDALQAELRSLSGSRKAIDAKTVMIRNEDDARRARIIARSLCVDAGAPRLLALKAATGLSELIRNILAYAGEGKVEISIIDDPPRRVRIRAIDRGPGIPNVDEILAGRYKSKTGLGRGLLGTRKIADRFAIETGDEGTTIDFEMFL